MSGVICLLYFFRSFWYVCRFKSKMVKIFKESFFCEEYVVCGVLVCFYGRGRMGGVGGFLVLVCGVWVGWGGCLVFSWVGGCI